MDGRIGDLRCRYRILSEPTARAAVQLRLDRLMRTDVVSRCEAMLDTAFADDPTVYIVRQLNINLIVADGAEDSAIVKHWGEQIVRGIVSVTDDTGDTQNLITFRDQADYVTHFLMDLASGRAWDRWFYGAFAGLEGLSFGDALRIVLDDNRAHFGQIMAYLYQYDALDKTLSGLDDGTLQNLWVSVGGDQQGQPAQIQPLFTLAFHLVDAVDWWTNGRPNEQETFQTYIANSPLAPDWRDPESLLQAVVSIFRHLNRRGFIRQNGSSQAALEDQIADLRHQYDWLDFDKLITQLSALSQPADTDLPLRLAHQRLTPRQRSLLEALKSVLEGSDLRLDNARLDASENAIRLLAVLLNEQPQWSDDSLTIPMIENLVQIWTLLVQMDAFKTADTLSLSNLEHLLSRLPSHTSEVTTRALRFLSATGELSLTVIQVMLQKTTSSDKPIVGKFITPSTVASKRPLGINSEGNSVQTACAGSFLLLRAVLDSKLPMLLDTSQYPNQELMSRISAALLTLGLYWSGRAGLSDDQIDPALLLLAGLENPVDLNDLQSIWQDASPSSARIFQRNLLHLLIGQRVLSAEALTLQRLHLGEHQTVLVAGTDTTQLWPFNTIIDHLDHEADVLANWLSDWEAATGQQPAIVDFPTGTENSHLPDVLDLLKLEDIGFIEPDLTIILTANTLLRMWARWLGQFAETSIQYLLTNFIRRPGTITLTEEIIFVELDARPLDIVLQMAGYLAETGSISWLGNRRVRFQIREQ